MSVALAPGVRTFEHPSGLSVVRGAVSNRLLAIGMARKGPLGVPVNIRNFPQFVDTFGDDYGYGELAVQMRQFFSAGGSDAIVIRAANGAVRSNLMLTSEAGDDVLLLQARDAGMMGDQIRAVVDYDTPDPEMTFNMTVFRETLDAQGRRVRNDEEVYGNLSMDQAAPNFIENIVNGASNLITATVQDDAGEAVLPDLTINNAANVFSQSGTFLADGAAFQAVMSGRPNPSISLEIDGVNIIDVNFGDAIVGVDENATMSNMTDRINEVLTNRNQSARVLVSDEPTAPGFALRIAVTSTDGTRSLRVLPAPSNDATGDLGLGSVRGGVEVGLYSQFRPAMTGFTVSPFTPAPGNMFDGISALAGAAAGNPTVEFSDVLGGAPTVPVVVELNGAANMLDDGDPATPPSLQSLQTHVDTMVAALNAALEDTWEFHRSGLRIQGTRLDGELVPAGLADFPAVTAEATNYFADVQADRPSAALGQDGGANGLDGGAPIIDDYTTVFGTVQRQVDIFNMLILPRGHNQTDDQRSFVWGAASNFCRDENALLIVDPRSDNNTWTTADAVVADVTDFKNGIVPEVSCSFWPRVRTSVGTSEVSVDPAGTVAGVMASTIARSGVWRAAAGLSAPLVGATGVEHPMSEAENGVINPRGINALRVKSTGAVVYGARTFAGDDNFSNRDFAYINVRMTTDFIKNSVSRALESFVFQNNNATTWANIELMVKSFMQGLYQKGAFRGTTADTAYDVQCNALTTSLADIQLGRLNVWVKFAPNFPAEFIHLHIQHMFQQPSA